MSESELKKRIREKFTILPKDIPPSFSTNPIFIGDTMIGQALDDILDQAIREFPDRGDEKYWKSISGLTCAEFDYSTFNTDVYRWLQRWLGKS